jgi:ribosomal protein L37AE/L43A
MSETTTLYATLHVERVQRFNCAECDALWEVDQVDYPLFQCAACPRTFTGMTAVATPLGNACSVCSHLAVKVQDRSCPLCAKETELTPVLCFVCPFDCQVGEYFVIYETLEAHLTAYHADAVFTLFRPPLMPPPTPPPAPLPVSLTPVEWETLWDALLDDLEGIIADRQTRQVDHTPTPANLIDQHHQISGLILALDATYNGKQPSSTTGFSPGRWDAADGTMRSVALMPADLRWLAGFVQERLLNFVIDYLETDLSHEAQRRQSAWASVACALVAAMLDERSR